MNLLEKDKKLINKEKTTLESCLRRSEKENQQASQAQQEQNEHLQNLQKMLEEAKAAQNNNKT